MAKGKPDILADIEGTYSTRRLMAVEKLPADVRADCEQVRAALRDGRLTASMPHAYRRLKARHGERFKVGEGAFRRYVAEPAGGA